MNEQVRQWLETADGEDYCPYCIHQPFCPRGLTGTPNGPFYPPCSDQEPEAFLDLEQLAAELEEDL